MAKRKEIKWRWEARGTMIGRQNGIIFRIYHPWDMPEREHTVSCYDTKRAGRTISTAGYRKFTWEEAVEFCQAIAAGEIDLEDLRAEFAAIEAERERQALRQAVAEAKEFRGHSFGCVGRYTKRPRKEVGIECTPAQYIEIEADFAFYSEAMKEEMELFYSAFLQKNGLFPPPELAAEPTEAEKEEWEDVERAWKIQSMMNGMDRHTRHKALEAAE